MSSRAAIWAAANGGALGPLGLSGPDLALGVLATFAITGATAGSVITASGLPGGWTLNSAARTLSGTPVAGLKAAVTLIETLAGKANSPKQNAFNIELKSTPASYDPDAAEAARFAGPADRWAGSRGQTSLLRTVVADAVTALSLTGPDRSAEFNTVLSSNKYQDVDFGPGYNPVTQRGGWRFGAEPVRVPFGTSLKGHGISSRVVVSPESTGPVFALNTDGAGSIITYPAPGVGPGLGNANISDLYINGALAVAAGNNLENVPAFEIGASYSFENVEIFRMQTMIRQPVGSYLDQVRVLNCKVSEQPDGTRYAVELDATNRRGDGVSIDGLHLTLPMGTTLRPRSVSLRNIQGAQVLNGLNGDHKFVACTGLTFRGFHGENGKVELTACTGDISCNTFWMRSGSQFGVTPLQFLQSATIGGQIGGSLFVHDNLWLCQESPVFLYDTVQKNLSFTVSSGRLRFDRNFLSHYVSNQGPVPIGNFGLLTGDAIWDAYSHFCSIGCELDDRGRLLISHDVVSLGASIPGLQGGGNSATDAGYGAWPLPSGTWYFQVVKWIDKPRGIGRTGANVVSLALTQGGPAPRLNIDAGDGPGIVSIYYGTVNGAFDRSIDIPYCGGSAAAVQGDHYLIYPSATRAAGPVDSVTNIQPAGYRIRPGDPAAAVAYGRVEVWNLASVMPNRGSWNVGDRVLNMDGSYYFRLTQNSNHVLNTDWSLKAA